MDYSPELAAMLDEYKLLQKRSVLGTCGCGRPDEILKMICRVLEVLGHFANDTKMPNWVETRDLELEAAIGAPRDSIAFELVMHHLDHVELTDHGGSISGSWPSALGEELLQASHKFQVYGENQWEFLEMALGSVGYEILNPEDRKARLEGQEK